MSNFLKTFRPAVLLAAGVSLALVLGGCKSAPPSDASLTDQVQSKIAADQNLGGQTIQASVSGGVVTLAGTVGNDTQRDLAAQDASQVAGVRTVVNNLQLQSAVAPMPAPAVSQTVVPTRRVKIAPSVPPPAPVVRENTLPPPPPPQVAQSAPMQPPPPQRPMMHTVTLAAGTTIPVRITQTLDSASAQAGDRFTGVLASDIVQDGMVVLPQGAAVSGRVDDAQDAGHFKGNSLLYISLTSIAHRGERIAVSTDPYSREGAGRGKNTAEKVGGGAAVGAILGGIFGGGKGAAIGAAAGGGVGAGANGVTRGQQVQIPSESVVRFRLAAGILVHVGPGEGDGGPQGGLERRNNQ